MTDEALRLRARILRAFAETGVAPQAEDSPALRELVAAHAVTLGTGGAIFMANPFAGYQDRARVESAGRTWWGNCPWDGYGIVAALGLRDATMACDGVTLTVRDGRARERDARFHVAVPAARWWDDIGFT